VSAGGACDRCRLRAFGQARRKYHFTASLRDQLREAYAEPGKLRRMRAILRLSKLTTWPVSAFRNEARLLDIVTTGQRKPWTTEEIAYIRETSGSKSATAIARKLHKSVCSVEVRVRRLKLSLRVCDGYSQKDLATVFGVHRSIAASWMRRGLFGRSGQAPGARISEGEVKRFLRRYLRECDLRRVDQAWYYAMTKGWDRWPD